MISTSYSKWLGLVRFPKVACIHIIYIYIYKIHYYDDDDDYYYIPVVPHKAVAEVSKIGSL